MATTARRCAGCGSPLPETPAPTQQLTCAFCGLVNELAPGTHVAPPVTITVDVGGAAQAAASVGRTVALVALLFVAVVGGIIAWTVYTAMRPVSSAIQLATQQIGNVGELQRAATAALKPQKLTPAALAGAGRVGWRELDVPAPLSGFAAFEPVTDLAWATSIAHAWQADARLTRIDVDRLKTDGTLDLTGAAANVAGYRFVSPSQVESWARIADRDASAEVPYELMVKIAEQKVTALIVRGKPPSQPLPPLDVQTHPLPELLKLALKSQTFAEHPFYNGYLIHLEREGWVWYLRSLSGQDSLPRVRARDGAVYPYR